MSRAQKKTIECENREESSSRLREGSGAGSDTRIPSTWLRLPLSRAYRMTVSALPYSPQGIYAPGSTTVQRV